MSYKEVDKIFQNWRKEQEAPRIYHPGIEDLNESSKMKKFLGGLGLAGLIGGGVYSTLDDDKTETKPKDNRTELQKYQDSIKEKGKKNWKDQKLAAKNAPANADGIIKKGFIII